MKIFRSIISLLTISSLLFPWIASAAITDNLVAGYKLSGNSNDVLGSWNGTDTSISYVTGLIGQGATTTGASASRIDIGNLPKTSSYTFSLWVKPFKWLYAGLPFEGAQAVGVNSYWGLFMREDDGTIQVYKSSGSAAQTATFSNSSVLWNSTNYPSNAWTHIVITDDNTNIRFYKNGTEVTGSPIASTVTNGGTANPMSLTRLGDQDAYYFGGVLDEVYIWSRAISSSEVTTLYNSGLGCQYAFSPCIPAANPPPVPAPSHVFIKAPLFIRKALFVR